MVCPKCKSESVQIQQVETGQVGTSHTTYKTKGHHGIIYMIIIGWWAWIFTFMFKLLKFCIFPFSVFFKKKTTIGTSNTVTATKTLTKTVAVCQSCGHSWDI